MDKDGIKKLIPIIVIAALIIVVAIIAGVKLSSGSDSGLAVESTTESTTAFVIEPSPSTTETVEISNDSSDEGNILSDDGPSSDVSSSDGPSNSNESAEEVIFEPATIEDKTEATSEDKTESTTEATTETSDDYVEYTFRNKDRRDEHYEKHGKAMGFDDALAYEKAASDVVNDPDALHKIEKEDGDDIYYLEDTNDFVVVSTDGYIRTYFWPDSGKKYYNKQ